MNRSPNNNTATDNTEMKVNLEDITNLVFSGGSVRGLAHVGAVDALTKCRGFDFRQIKRVGGTSAGAIVAVLFALGYEISDIKKIIKGFDFQAMLDDDGIISTSHILMPSEEVSSEEVNPEEAPKGFFNRLLNGVKASAQASQQAVAVSTAPIRASGRAAHTSVAASAMASRVMNGYSLYKGDFFLKWVQDIIEAKTGNPHLTFRELSELSQSKESEGFRELSVMGASLNEDRSQIFSYQTTPNVTVASAIRISMSIPILFKPYQPQIPVADDQGVVTLLPKDLNKHYVDGGLVDNCPTHLFDECKDDSADSQQTLAFRLFTKNKLDFYISETGQSDYEEVNSISKFLKKVVNLFMTGQEEAFWNSTQNRARTVCIATPEIGITQFNLSEQQQEGLMDSGYDAVKKAFEKAFEESSSPGLSQ